MRSIMMYVPYQILFEKNGMGGVCRVWGGVLMGWGNLRERDHLEEPNVNGWIILTWIFRKWDEGMDWIDLAKDRDTWRALVNAVMNFRVP
jgi:hypothetical protein